MGIKWRVSSVVHPIMYYWGLGYKEFNERADWAIVNVVAPSLGGTAQCLQLIVRIFVSVIYKVLKSRRSDWDKVATSDGTSWTMAKTHHWRSVAHRAASSYGVGLYNLSDRRCLQWNEGEPTQTLTTCCAWRISEAMKQPYLRSWPTLFCVSDVSNFSTYCWRTVGLVDSLWWSSTISWASSGGTVDGSDMLVKPEPVCQRMMTSSQVQSRLESGCTEATHIHKAWGAVCTVQSLE